MIEALERFDRRTAAGILARAALALGSDGNPDARPVVSGEEKIRSELIAAGRHVLGIAADDVRDEALERLGDWLEHQATQLLGEPNIKSAMDRLAYRGELTSDRFGVDIVRNISDFHGRHFAGEKLLIENTVHHPDRQQHFGPPSKPSEPFLISMFAKWFRDEFPYKSFLMLVAGQRRGQSIEVHQAWRLYPAYVKFSDEMDLVDLLRSFAETYGVDVSVGEHSGHFILAAEIDNPAQITVRVPDKTTATVSHFWQSDPNTGKRQAALIVGINLDLYERTLRKMR